MIVGIGTDIVEIARIENAYSKNPRFLDRVFTQQERDYALALGTLNYQRLGGMWAAKEAFAKATGEGFRNFGLKDVEIKRDQLGAPYLVLHNRASDFAKGNRVHLSISHSDISAIAYCIIEKKEVI